MIKNCSVGNWLPIPSENELEKRACIFSPCLSFKVSKEQEITKWLIIIKEWLGFLHINSVHYLNNKRYMLQRGGVCGGWIALCVVNL